MFKSHQFSVRKVALAVLPALVMTGSAFAAGATEGPPAVTVRYADLNLDRAQDVAVLYRRINEAATQVCRPAQGPESVSRLLWTAWKHCFYHAVNQAVNTVHNERLSAYHWQRVRGSSYQAEGQATVASR